MTGIPVGRIPRQEALVLLEPDWEAASSDGSGPDPGAGSPAKWGSAGALDSLSRDSTHTIPSEVKPGGKRVIPIPDVL